MIRINLLPVRVSRKKAAGKQQLVLFAALVVLGFAFNFVWAGTRASELKVRQQKVTKTRDEIAQLDRIIGEVKNIKEQQAALREKLGILADLKAGRTGPVRVMDALATLTPKRLWITKYDEKNGAATINGVAATFDDVSAFMTALKGNPYFGGVELTKSAATAAPGGKKLELVEFTLATTILYTPVRADASGQPAAPAR